MITLLCSMIYAQIGCLPCCGMPSDAIEDREKETFGIVLAECQVFQSHMLVRYFTRLIRFVLSEWAYDDGVFVRWCMGGGGGRGRR